MGAAEGIGRRKESRRKRVEKEGNLHDRNEIEQFGIFVVIEPTFTRDSILGIEGISGT